ncbi:MAG: glycogen-binding domain-containing protein [Phaeodactylibacter sp.]|nr:glycogen-binding domain-containing protein [Phaeodactylibacter sp.]
MKILNQHKMKILHILFLILASAAPALAQPEEEPYRAYYFEGDEVVFEFDLRYFEEATLHDTKKRVDFDDLDVYEVAVAGDFNNWSRKKWKMKKVGPQRYQLRKKIEDFDDAFKWEYKFVINGEYWAEPSEDITNKSKVVHGDIVFSDAYNISFFTARQTSDGNVRFFLPGFEEAGHVALTGSFNGWDEHAFIMDRVEGGWATRLQLDAGRYEYKFIVDGQWIEDPYNPEKRKNQYHTYNSILHVAKPVTFRLENYDDAQEVALAGSFNDWRTDDVRMHREGNAWVATLELKGGKHWYKFIVDGKWIADPANPFKEHDGMGNINSVIIVK